MDKDIEEEAQCLLCRKPGTYWVTFMDEEGIVSPGMCGGLELLVEAPGRDQDTRDPGQPSSRIEEERGQ
jgi:hypothetical protein